MVRSSSETGVMEVGGRGSQDSLPPPRVGTQMSQEDAEAGFRKLEMLQEERGTD